MSFGWIAIPAIIFLFFAILITLRLVFAGLPRFCRRLRDGSKAVGKVEMAAVFHTSHGSPDVLKVHTHEAMPWYADDEVLVKVEVASVNPVDYKFLRGDLKLFEGLLGMGRVPGFDLAGTVAACGPLVDSFTPGDRVFGMAAFSVRGTMAEYCALAAHRLAPLPPSLSFQAAAALPLVGQTSYQALVELGHVTRGSRVFIIGGPTATGLAAIQIARHFQAAAIVVTSSERNRDLVMRMGATTVVGKKRSEWVAGTKGQTFDVVYACVPSRDASAFAGDVLTKKGVFISINGEDGGAMRMVSKYASSWLGLGHAYHVMTCFGSGERQQLVAAMAASGSLNLPVDSVYPLEKARDAFERVRAGKSQGKVLISIGEASCSEARKRATHETTATSATTTSLPTHSHSS